MYSRAHKNATIDLRAAGQVVAPENGRGKSGLHRAACRLTAGGLVTDYGKCNRKYTAGSQGPVRVKWCGKSAPRPEQFGWLANPTRSKTK